VFGNAIYYGVVIDNIMMMNNRQIRKAIFIVWIILSSIIFLTLATPFLVSSTTINSFVPVCEWKLKYNKKCPLCGMTTSFINISHGNFLKASMSNRFGPYLYLSFVVNEIAVLLVLLQKIKFYKRSTFP